MNTWLALLCTIITCVVFVGMCVSYTRKRAQRRYAADKVAAPSISSYTSLSKFLFISSMALTMMSHWYTPLIFLPLYKTTSLTVIGTALIAISFVLLLRSFRDLGNNYSPMFDAWLPNELVTDNTYSLIRHPVYAFNLMISAGMAISSGLGIVFLNGFIGAVFVMKAIRLEEQYLSAHFPQYTAYTKRSWRLLPYIY